MKELICIVCPNGCHLCIDETTLNVTGNKCKRGEDFAKKELISPVRTVCTTVRTVFKDCPVVPVRTSSEIPLEKIFEVMAEIKKIRLKTRVKRGEIVISNVLDLGCDIVITSDRLTEAQ